MRGGEGDGVGVRGGRVKEGADGGVSWREGD